jgi:DNA-binding response OmpR family regulator
VKILIVEDQRRIGAFLERALREHSYAVTWVRSCREALDALCESSHDAIILDLGLPDGDGIDLLSQWRKSGFNEPVLILSARDAVQDRIKGLDLGADDYLSKPFTWKNFWRACVPCCAVNRPSRRRSSNTAASSSIS